MVNRQEVEGLKIHSYENMCGQRERILYIYRKT